MVISRSQTSTPVIFCKQCSNECVGENVTCCPECFGADLELRIRTGAEKPQSIVTFCDAAKSQPELERALKLLAQLGRAEKNGPLYAAAAISMESLLRARVSSLVAAGDWNAAMFLSGGMVESLPDSVNAQTLATTVRHSQIADLLSKARSNLANHLWKQVRSLCAQVRKLDRDNIEAHALSGSATEAEAVHILAQAQNSFNACDWIEATALCRKALDLQEENKAAQSLSATAELLLAMDGKAIDDATGRARKLRKGLHVELRCRQCGNAAEPGMRGKCETCQGEQDWNLGLGADRTPSAWLVDLLNTLQLQGKPDLIIANTEQILNFLSPDDPLCAILASAREMLIAPLLTTAQRHIQNAEWELARSLCRKAFELVPNHPSAKNLEFQIAQSEAQSLLVSARRYRDKQEWDKAKENCLQAIDLLPQDVTASQLLTAITVAQRNVLLTKAQQCVVDGTYDRSIEIARALQVLIPGDADAQAVIDYASRILNVRSGIGNAVELWKKGEFHDCVRQCDSLLKAIGADFTINVPDFADQCSALKHAAFHKDGELRDALRSMREARERKDWVEVAKRAIAVYEICPLNREAQAATFEAGRMFARADARKKWIRRILRIGIPIFLVWFTCNRIDSCILTRRAQTFEVALERSDYPTAAKAGRKITARYSRAKDFVEYWDARTAFETALASTDMRQLMRYGGSIWNDMDAQRRIGETNVSDPSKGKDAYLLALAKLPKVKSEAEARMNADADKKAREVAAAQAKAQAAAKEAQDRRLAEEKFQVEKRAESDRAETARCRGIAERDWAQVESELSRTPAASQIFAAFDQSSWNAWQTAADAGVPEGQVLIAWCYELGCISSQSEAKAVEYYRKAADQGNARAQFNLGVMCLNRNTPEFAEGLKWMRKAADQGVGQAQVLMGTICHEGFGVPADPKEAVQWWRKAAEQGLVMSQYNLGIAYLNGDGVSKDDDEAIRWFRLAARQGDKKSIQRLDALNVAPSGWLYKGPSCGRTTKVAKRTTVAFGCPTCPWATMEYFGPAY